MIEMMALRACLLLALVFLHLKLALAQYEWFPDIRSDKAFNVDNVADLVLPRPNCTHPTEFYTQKVDHFDNLSTETFQQQYQVISDYFKPGAPILYYQGAENARMGCSVR